MSYQYTNIILGGTFDLLHKGHKSILAAALKLGGVVTIGITTDKFNLERNKPTFQNQNLRYKNLKDFLKSQDYIKKYKIIFINDHFGTTLKDTSLQAIVVSKATKGVTKLINQKRFNSGLKKLDIITLPYTKGEDRKIISSTRIRQGEINPSGQSYKKMLLGIAGKKLANNIRLKLKNPLGPLISSTPRNFPKTPTISIGDVTTANLLKANLQPKLAVIDLKVQRKDFHMSPLPSLRGGRGVDRRSNLLNKIAALTTFARNDGERIKNPPGQISRSLILAIEKALKKIIIHVFRQKKESSAYNSKFIILIDGEEDLAAIPTILLSPLGTTVFYGQPNKGMVQVKVDLKVKDYLLKLLKL